MIANAQATRWKGKPPRLTAEQTQIVREAYARRAALRAKLAEIPSAAKLARQFGVATETVRNYYKRTPKRLLRGVQT